MTLAAANTGEVTEVELNDQASAFFNGLKSFECKNHTK